jgi:transcriptional regulator with XRE-family HTH domain
MTQGSLATRLRVLRAQRGLSLTDAANLAGIQRQTLAKLERGGTRPHDVTLSKIAAAYDVDVEDLLDLDDEPPALKAEAPQVTMEQFADHGIQPTSAEVATLNAKLKTYTEIAQAGDNKPRKLTIPEGPVDMTRVDLLIEYACMSGMLTPEDLSILAYGVARELAAGRS